MHNKSKCLSRIYYVPDTFISAFIVVIALLDRYYYYPQFTGEDGPDRLKNLPNIIHLISGRVRV